MSYFISVAHVSSLQSACTMPLSHKQEKRQSELEDGGGGRRRMCDWMGRGLILGIFPTKIRTANLF